MMISDQRSFKIKINHTSWVWPKEKTSVLKENNQL